MTINKNQNRNAGLPAFFVLRKTTRAAKGGMQGGAQRTRTGAAGRRKGDILAYTKTHGFWARTCAVATLLAVLLCAVLGAATTGYAVDTATWVRISEAYARLHEDAEATLTANAAEGATLVWQMKESAEADYTDIAFAGGNTLTLSSSMGDLSGAFVRVKATLSTGDVQVSAPVPVEVAAHSLKRTQAKAPTCEGEGNVEYWTCSLCDKHFTDAAATSAAEPEALRIAAAGHTFEYVPEKPATTEADGCPGYWECQTCHRKYKDKPAKDEFAPEELFISRLGHSYVIQVTKPTCTQGGFTTYSCDHCSDTYTGSETDSLGHDLEEITGDEPTETESGITRHWVCRRCGELFTDSNGENPTTADQVIRPATGHTYTDDVHAPDCTNPGYTIRTCSVCNHAEKADEKDPLGHDWKTVPAVDATCTQDGNIEYEQCTRCDAIKGNPDVVIKATGHSYVDTVVDPTCTEGGYTEHVCSKCDDSYTDSETLPNGHTLVKVDRIEPTTTAPGNITYYRCSVCGKLFADEE